MLTITRAFRFDAGHRVLGHEGKCRHIHGHSYLAEVTVTAPELDGLGRVIDFSVLKEKVGHWIDANWDHNILLHPEDPLLRHYKPVGRGPLQIVEASANLFGGKAPYVMPRGNPTAERIAEDLYDRAGGILAPYNIKVTHVRIYETPNCWSDYMET